MIIGDKILDLKERTYIMGILNVTPDSFSDGGDYINVEVALKRVKDMIAEGVDIIDIGGESTRPGAEYVNEEEEINRVIPVIKAIKKELDILISVDTYKSITAKAAILAGADIINDIWGFKKDKEMAKLVADNNVTCVLMHNREIMNYNNIMEDVIKDLEESIEIALSKGVKKEKIILDPGIGFAKSYEENLIVMNNLEDIVSLGYPVLLATSRKSMIGRALDLPVSQ
uniref:dihydropteroate synthase n=1 Tax=Clostridium sp. TaxID=1506 RepID=UPI002630E5CA